MRTSKSIPLVSVCIPTFNGERFLDQCLNSVCEQTLGDFEAVLVDDCSSDATRDIAEAWAARDRRIRYIANNQNVGLVSNWNRCVTHASGQWIKYLFQDDLLDSRCLEAMVSGARKDRPLRFCYRRLIQEQHTEELFIAVAHSPTVQQIFPGANRIEPQQLIDKVVDMFAVNFLGEPTSVLLHRSVFQRFGGFNANLTQLCDLEFWLRVGVNCGVDIVPERLASFRLHLASATAKNFNNKAYRLEIIEPLILRHEVLYNRHFAPMRRVAAKRGMKKRMVREIGDIAFRTRRLAESRAAAEPGLYGSMLADWNAVADSLPRLEKTLRYRELAARRWADRHILWRFRKRDSHPA